MTEEARLVGLIEAQLPLLESMATTLQIIANKLDKLDDVKDRVDDVRDSVIDAKVAVDDVKFAVDDVKAAVDGVRDAAGHVEAAVDEASTEIPKGVWGHSAAGEVTASIGDIVKSVRQLTAEIARSNGRLALDGAMATVVGTRHEVDDAPQELASRGTSEDTGQSGFGEEPEGQCHGTTSKGTRCRFPAIEVGGFCLLHQPA